MSRDWSQKQNEFILTRRTLFLDRERAKRGLLAAVSGLHHKGEKMTAEINIGVKGDDSIGWVCWAKIREMDVVCGPIRKTRPEALADVEKFAAALKADPILGPNLGKVHRVGE